MLGKSVSVGIGGWVCLSAVPTPPQRRPAIVVSHVDMDLDCSELIDKKILAVSNSSSIVVLY